MYIFTYIQIPKQAKQPRINNPSHFVHMCVCNARGRLSLSEVPDFPEVLYNLVIDPAHPDRVGRYERDMARLRMEIDTFIGQWRTERAAREARRGDRNPR